MSIYLAIDLGTTGCRSILFNSKLEEISESYQEYGLIIVERPSKKRPFQVLCKS